MPYSNVHGIEIINVTPPLIFLVAEILNGYPQDVYFRLFTHLSYYGLCIQCMVQSHYTQGKELMCFTISPQRQWNYYPKLEDKPNHQRFARRGAGSNLPPTSWDI